MKPIAEFSADWARDLQFVFTDIDDTLTDEGLLRSPAYSALWQLKEAGISVIAVTGRPAGWCDHFARMWPVEAVVGENGAFSMHHDHAASKLVVHRAAGAPEPDVARKRLAALSQDILQKVPGCALASDQDFRWYDLAIDFCEDVPPLDQAAIDAIVQCFVDAGATAKVSSIHVNGWFGAWDKLTMMTEVAKRHGALDLDRAEHRRLCAYVGDSPNDEPAFVCFRETSVGVANLLKMRDRLQTLPAWITTASGGAGFAEFAGHILNSRG